MADAGKQGLYSTEEIQVIGEYTNYLETVVYPDNTVTSSVTVSSNCLLQNL
jgi:hypothetical protein